jgi:hypothetical protein
MVLSYLPPARQLGFRPLPGPMLAVLMLITTLYIFAAEGEKRWFYRYDPRPPRVGS